jgi:hypothetical protein
MVCSSQQKSVEVSSMVYAIKSTLEQTEVKKAIIYTDGSTSPKGKSPNSGCGIFITDENHSPLWSGGAVIRTEETTLSPNLQRRQSWPKPAPETFLFSFA